jgi:hypothetical protein
VTASQAAILAIWRQDSAHWRHISAQRCMCVSSPNLAQSSAQRAHTSAQTPQVRA